MDIITKVKRAMCPTGKQRNDGPKTREDILKLYNTPMFIKKFINDEKFTIPNRPEILNLITDCAIIMSKEVDYFNSSNNLIVNKKGHYNIDLYISETCKIIKGDNCETINNNYGFVGRILTKVPYNEAEDLMFKGIPVWPDRFTISKLAADNPNGVNIISEYIHPHFKIPISKNYDKNKGKKEKQKIKKEEALKDKYLKDNNLFNVKEARKFLNSRWFDSN